MKNCTARLGSSGFGRGLVTRGLINITAHSRFTRRMGCSRCRSADLNAAARIF